MTARSSRRPGGALVALAAATVVLAPVPGRGQDEPPPATEEEPGAESARPKLESVSRQFVVYGGSGRLRSAVAGLAEATRDALLKEVRMAPQFQHPVVIEMAGQPGDPAPPRLMRASFFEVAGGFRLQLDLHLAKGVDRDELERHLLELLLYERGLRDRKPGDVDETIAISPWLSVGLLESFRWRTNRGDRRLYEALFERNALYPVDRLLETVDVDRLDAGSRSAFRASAGALVMALLGQPDGRAAMDRLLAEAATFDGEDRALLAKHFPKMNLGQQSLAKWWVLQLARLAERPAWDTMTIRETEEALGKTLVVRFNDDAGNLYEVGPEQFRDLLALPGGQRREVIEATAEAVSELSLSAFPGYLPLIAGYLQVLGELADDRDERVAERLAELDRARAQFTRMGERTRDYLDWYRITQGQKLSGAFREYAELKEKLEAAPEPRSGPVSRYLDDVQKLYERENGGP